MEVYRFIPHVHAPPPPPPHSQVSRRALAPYTNVLIRRLDGLADPAALAELLRELQPQVLVVDIGGDRALADVVVAVDTLLAALPAGGSEAGSTDAARARTRLRRLQARLARVEDGDDAGAQSAVSSCASAARARGSEAAEHAHMRTAEVAELRSLLTLVEQRLDEIIEIEHSGRHEEVLVLIKSETLHAALLDDDDGSGAADPQNDGRVHSARAWWGARSAAALAERERAVFRLDSAAPAAATRGAGWRHDKKRYGASGSTIAPSAPVTRFRQPLRYPHRTAPTGPDGALRVRCPPPSRVSALTGAVPLPLLSTDRRRAPRSSIHGERGGREGPGASVLSP